jgi:riboflavin synthase
MFTGLIKGTGVVREVFPFGRGRRFRIELGALSGVAAIGQSMAVNGTCLTLTGLAGGVACFDAVSETVSRTNLGLLRPGDRVNLEPALRAGDALDGHIVQGHIDVAAPVRAVDASRPETRTITIALPASISRLVAEKGSVAVDGVSLTVSGVGRDFFAIAVIPHTWENTTLSLRKPGDPVNIEVDVLARYTARLMGLDSPDAAGPSEAFLEAHGFLRSRHESDTGL